MSPHTYITVLLKFVERNKKEKKKVISKWGKKVDKRHMMTKCPKQLVCLPRDEDHWYAPHFEIKFHPKNVQQCPKNPLAHQKYVSHMWPKCSFEEFICMKRSLMDSKACTLTPWP
jgi:hypothetical protein